MSENVQMNGQEKAILARPSDSWPEAQILQYRVTDISADGSLLAFRDEAGRNHIGRVDRTKLRIDDELQGLPVTIGLLVLLSIDGRQMHKAIVEDIDCPPNVAVIRLHPDAAADAFFD